MPNTNISSTNQFQTPFTHSRSKVLKAFAATGIYSKEFLKGLKKGLEDNKDFFRES